MVFFINGSTNKEKNNQTKLSYIHYHDFYDNVSSKYLLKSTLGMEAWWPNG